MMRSMFAGVSGLRNHQTRMDVIGNNIANVNTVGYKTSRVTFQDALYQTLRGATAPQGNRGGMNPQQVGLGVTLSSIDVIHTPGNLQTTGVSTDLAIQGNGFFVFADGNQQYFSRAGNLTMDTSGRLVASNGLQIQGWEVLSDGSLSGQLKGITLPINTTIAPKATTEIRYTANFDAGLTRSLIYEPIIVGTPGNSVELSVTLTPGTATNQWNIEIETDTGAVVYTGTITLDHTGKVDAITNPGGTFTVTLSDGTDIDFDIPNVGDKPNFICSSATETYTLAGKFTAFTSSTEVFDSRGTAHILTTTFTKIDDHTWHWITTSDSGLVLSNNSGTLSFDVHGNLVNSSGGPITFTPPGADSMSITPVFSSITHYDGETSIVWAQNGYEMGYLDSFKIDSAGKIIGVFTNGLTKDIAQIAIATFNNPAGLEKVGETMFVKSNNSGEPAFHTSGVGGSGRVTPGALEMSNVDLSQEFTDMIITQRGFQANSRIITTSDEMLQELVNLKR